MFWTVILSIVLIVLTMIYSFLWWTSHRHGELEKLGFTGPPIKSRLTGAFDMKMHFMDTILEFHQKFKHHKVYAVQQFSSPTLWVSSLDIIKDILTKHFNQFSDRTHMPKTGLHFDKGPLVARGQEWKDMRKAISPLFSTSKLRTISTFIEKKSKFFVESLIEKQKNDEAVELKEMTSAFTMDAIASTVFGVEVDTIKEPGNTFAEKTKKLDKQFGNLFIYDNFFPLMFYLPKAIIGTLIGKDVLDYFETFISQAVKLRQSEGQGKRKDFIQMLIDSGKEGKIDLDGLQEQDKDLHTVNDHKFSLSYEDIQSLSTTFVIAGYETTSTTISFGLYCLANNRNSLKKVQEEIDQVLCGEAPNYDNINDLTYLEMCICESLRLFPPGFLIERLCTETVEVQGITFPKGVRVNIPTYALLHDGDIWPEPEKFDPERFTADNKATRHSAAFIPFSLGPRNCVGMRLAQLEVKIALATVLQHLTPVHCDKTVYPVKLDPFRMKAESGLWVKFEPRQ